ncbi:MAG: AAA domain-containing protein [Metamycoplasmataceae bacterium]
MENNQKEIEIKNIKKEKTDKYKKILNNLLNISINDSCLFHTINNQLFFDVLKKFGPDFFKKIISNEFFTISLKENDLMDFSEEIQNCLSPEEIRKIFITYNNEISESIDKKLMQATSDKKLQEIKEIIIDEAKITRQKAAFKWKIILNKARSINEQNNLWPLHLGFGYISVVIDEKAIQAPLFFKEVNIKIQNSNVSLVSIGDIKINEKLIYFLETQGYLFDLDFDYSKFSILKVYETITKNWSQNFDIPLSLIGNVPNFKQNEIKNSTITFWPGVSLGFFEPTGGHLRKIMVDIIEKDIIDDILEVEFDKNIYRNNVNKSIFKKNFGFFKIQHSNYSQDKAVVSSLNQNTIIWGPPGTGKSQTITNILTNILMYQKTALVVSQKKAALEVLKNRMEELEIFCLFILNDKEMNKKTFYKPIQDYIDYIENLNEDYSDNSIKLLNDDEREFLDKLKQIKNEKDYETNLELYSNFISKQKFDIEKVEKILELNENFVYDFENLKSQKNFNKYLFTKNALQKKNIFVKYPKTLKNATKNIKNNLLDISLELDLFLKNKDKISLDLMKLINSIETFNLNKNSEKINDPKILKVIIAKTIVSKMKNLSKEMKIKYNKFALDARTMSLDINSFIKKHSEIIKILFPIIITTPETDLQAWTQKEFDYALLDESSQIFLEKGLPILYLAKIKILAGDDQQMQPTRWFASKAEGESEFGDIESILDFAKAKGVYNILLDKNYRSKYASLMSFNSRSFYESKLDVVDVNLNKQEIPIEVFNVDGIWENSINKKEIDFSIVQIKENIQKYKKIILLCFNGAQLQEIEKIIFQSEPELEKAILEGKLLLRNIENIQGDEADLVIMSIVYDKTTKLHASYVAKKGGKNALNVAISRAKEKMIIIKSIYSENVNISTNSDDAYIFKEWLRFLDLSDDEKKNYVNNVETKEHSNNNNNEEWRKDFQELIWKQMESLVTEIDKIEIISNFSIGTIKIDLAILDRRNNRFICGFLLDNFDYFNSYDEYILKRDKKIFFIIKGYDVVNLTKINIYKELKQISKKINKYFLKNI